MRNLDTGRVVPQPAAQVIASLGPDLGMVLDPEVGPDKGRAGDSVTDIAELIRDGGRGAAKGLSIPPPAAL
jgi:hypothetical protein